MDLLAKYWWFSMKVATSIKGEDDELVENLAAGLEIAKEDVLLAYVKDAEKAVVAEHTPDIALIVCHETKTVVLTVCGTKAFPVPSMADVIMVGTLSVIFIELWKKANVTVQRGLTSNCRTSTRTACRSTAGGRTAGWRPPVATFWSARCRTWRPSWPSCPGTRDQSAPSLSPCNRTSSY